jgi:hypothetical protein
MLRLCIPRVEGRGSGLGNELVPWCRAFLAATVLDAHCLTPAFGLNRRQYGRHFGTPRADWILHRALRSVLPVYEFTEADYRDCGAGDVASALARYAAKHQLDRRSVFVLSTSGMWGGMFHIEAAREFARSTLYRSRFAARNLLKIRERLDPELPTVGLHIRMGDFHRPDPTQDYRGKFNATLPIEWFHDVARSILEQSNDRVQFLLVTDAEPEIACRLLGDIDCIITADLADSDCSDLLALASADLLVCSVSTYSIWAAFLSNAPYLWFGPQLQPHPGDAWSIWGHEFAQQPSDSPTVRALDDLAAGRQGAQRGWPQFPGLPVPEEAIAAMRCQYAARTRDLVRYGAAQAKRCVQSSSKS